MNNIKNPIWVSAAIVLLCGACSKAPEAAASGASSAATPAAAPTPTPAAVPDKPASCDSRKSMGICIDFGPAQIGKGEESLKKGCSLSDDVFAWAPCPSEALMGSCKAAKGGYVTRYYKVEKATYETPEEAKKVCTEDGSTWQ